MTTWRIKSKIAGSVLLILVLLLSVAGTVNAALSDNITHYWKIDESSGNISDSVGSLTGTNTSVDFSTGKINNAGDFNATTDKFQFADTSLISGTSDFTISFWVKWTSGLFIIARRDSYPAENWEIFYDGTNLTMLTGAATTLITAATTLADGNWHHIVITRSGTTTWVMYKDNSSIGTSSASDSIPTGHTLRFGETGEGASLGSVMLLDEVGTWSRALDSSEVASLYNSGAGLQYPFTVASTPEDDTYFELL